MAKSCPTSSEDLMLADIALANMLYVCTAQPANYAGIAAVTLASVALTPGNGNGSFTLNNDTGGRNLTVTAQTNVAVTANGTANHIVLALTSGSVLKYVTTCSSQALVNTGTVTIPSWKIVVPGPV